MDVGKKLQSLRTSREMSQRELASRAGLTNGTVSLIEQNKTSPSVASLKRLLDALDINISEFFSTIEGKGAPRVFYRAHEFMEIAPQGAPGALSLRQLGSIANRQLQVLDETYPPGADTGAEQLTHQAEEAGVVISGRIEITAGDQVAVLGPGDGYIFDSTLPHRFRNIGDEVCRIISACTPPTF